ncbi:MAG: HAD family hydrolase [Acidimicrobiia bacterium]
MLGPGPVVDFDGTLTTLGVSWSDLRARLDVGHIDELWDRGGDDGWAEVTQAELEAAATAGPAGPVFEALEQAEAVAVLTGNAEASVWRFLGRFDALRARIAVVVGRETLAGPKRDYGVFARGFRRCVEATKAVRSPGEPVVYVGDLPYELEFARRLGAHAIDVTQITGAR